MDRFDVYIDRILDHEGGYNNRSPEADPGGETKWGISKRSYPHLNIAALTREEAIEIYRRDFWLRVHGPELPPEIAFQALDGAVNSGIGNSVRWLQRAAMVADDGVIGPITLGRIKCTDPHDLVLRYLAERLEFMTKLNNWPHNSRGWARRIVENMRHAAEDN